jgi:hypothetical protein
MIERVKELLLSNYTSELSQSIVEVGTVKKSCETAIAGFKK